MAIVNGIIALLLLLTLSGKYRQRRACISNNDCKGLQRINTSIHWTLFWIALNVAAIII